MVIVVSLSWIPRGTLAPLDTVQAPARVAISYRHIPALVAWLGPVVVVVSAPPAHGVAVAVTLCQSLAFLCVSLAHLASPFALPMADCRSQLGA